MKDDGEESTLLRKLNEKERQERAEARSRIAEGGILLHLLGEEE